MTFETKFDAFTEYFYRVVAFNSQGRTPSDWILIRTSESMPNYKVNISLLQATPISGYKIKVENMDNYCYYCNSSNIARIASVFTGITNRFVLSQYEFNQTLNGFSKLRSFDFYCETVCSHAIESFASSSIDSLIRENFDPNARELYLDTTPITNYSLIVSVCNSAGCVQSEQLLITTLGEVPDGLTAPRLLKRASDSLELEWPEPKFTSGNITGYILRRVNYDQTESVIYFGLRRQFKITNLKALTNYTFVLEVCNLIGCSRSAQVTYFTNEMAPLSVPQPTVVNVTQSVIVLRWSKPSNEQIINGHIVGYILYLTSDENEYRLNSSTYNISTCEECSSNLKYLDNLVAGTDYNVTLSACTYGGCTNASVVTVRTMESLPTADDVRISIFSRNSTSITIEWTRPKRPNGKLESYIVLVDNQLNYRGLSNK